jgi:hypothetical protein
MKVAIILGRGIEGCGVTRYALEEQKWYQNNGMQCDIYAGADKKWGRKDAQENDIIEFGNNEIEALSKKLNDEYSIVYYQSLPSKKGHSESYQQAFYDHLVCAVTKPIKLSHQNDHKAQSLIRNSMIWETMAQMDASFTHSLTSPFAKKMKEFNPDVPVLKMGLGFDFDSLRQYWKPIETQKKRISYFGRFAGFKDPQRIVDMQPELERVGIIGEMRGIERSIGSLDLFYSDLSDRANSYRSNIHEVKKDENITQVPEKVWIYGPYNRLEGIEELSTSMFGADFYNLDAEAYGNNMEFAMCEIIACGTIPVFDKHWADNCTHLNGTLFAKMKDFAVYSDRSNLADTADQLAALANDHEAREARRQRCFEIAKQHCDNDVVYRRMHEDALKVKKRNPNTNTKVTQNALF